MNDYLDILIYLDENLIKNLSSTAFNGYIDIKTHKEICDNSISGKVHFETREQFFEEDRFNKELKEGYKSKNNGEMESYQNSNEKDNSLETSGFKRNENEIRQIYTSFSIHNNLINSMYGNNMIKDMTNSNIKESDYIIINGHITTISVVSYLEILLNILKSYDTEILNKLIEKDSVGLMNFTTIYNVLTHLLDQLTKSNTVDLIIYSKNTIVFATVNRSFFMNESASIFDKVDCPCKLFGKIIKKSKSGETISLLRKTTQQQYYEDVIEKISIRLKLLEEEGIILPKMPKLSIAKDYLVVIPLSIYL